MSDPLKKNTPVTFKTHRSSGSGRIAAVEATPKGDWYSVKDDEGKVIKLRRAHLTPVV